ncbi:hypothetical protein [Longimicrobium sp.]|uniref:hypothetical protein n=1 Tax=Longimicrobium sp. TaxID=2029185 RepID=UPI002BE9F92A|nr:hypothetical protein [Longimicrobium sp.]HSU13826.1 hypothetical protein [Longimicrobium sp.]
MPKDWANLPAFIPLALERIMGDQDKEYSEKSTSETRTKTDTFGSPEKDAAGENVKETTTETEGREESDDSDDGDD